MKPTELSNLAISARRRLDEAFPEEEETAVDPTDRRQGLAYLLGRLKPIAAALEWKVPREALREYRRELAAVRSVFCDDPEAMVLIRIQDRLCRLVASRPAGVHPAALALLGRCLKALESVALEPPGSSRRLQTARRLRREYAQMMSVLHPRAAPAAGRPETPSGRTARPAAGGGPPLSRAVYLIPVRELDALRAAIRREVERLPALIVAALKRR